MRIYSLLIASAITTALALPAMAQQSTTQHRYAAFYKYTDQMIKELIDHPQERDRGAAISKLFETYGVKIEAGYIFPMGGEFDGLLIVQAPNDTAIEAIQLVTRSGGTAVRSVVVPVVAANEFRTLMEAAKQGAASYAPPGR
jgi:uncharacterized protein with GYD domain